MSQALPRPRWVDADADWMGELPRVTRYGGPVDQAIRWFGGTSRRRYQIDVGSQCLDVNVAQARAIAQMLLADPALRAEIE